MSARKADAYLLLIVVGIAFFILAIVRSSPPPPTHSQSEYMKACLAISPVHEYGGSYADQWNFCKEAVSKAR